MKLDGLVIYRSEHQPGFYREAVADAQSFSAKGAEYDSQGQVRSEAEHVAAGSLPTTVVVALKGRNTEALLARD